MPKVVSEEFSIGRSVVRLVRDDVTELDVDAFVFYAQHDLVLGSGFGTAISLRGGPQIQKELDELGPVETGHVVVTEAGNLKAKFIVHAVGPRFNERDVDRKLRTTVLNSLKAAEEKGVKRFALPPMGAGFYGVPLDLCARVMVDTIKSYLEGETGIQEVDLCMMDQREFAPFESQLASLSR
ncbi:MAG: macro domain-containing protein [Planctomycetota bacterium]|jgi:O-acetyl-ADP-ribose deacetylase (regulator of RNase III)